VQRASKRGDYGDIGLSEEELTKLLGNGDVVLEIK